MLEEMYSEKPFDQFLAQMNIQRMLNNKPNTYNVEY
jgi:hypothetical protein